MILYGCTTALPLHHRLSAVFTGATVPGPVIATGGIVSLQFHSDGATVKDGYKILYTCYPGPYIAKTINSGNWNDPQTWQYGVVPRATDSVMIMAGHNVAVNTSAQVQQLTIAATGTLGINNAAINFTIGNALAKKQQID